MEEILKLEKQIEETNKLIEELKRQVKELKEISKQKERKNLNDYRIYENLQYGMDFKCLNGRGRIYYDTWENSDIDRDFLKNGNVYSNDTPDELLEKEIKRRQLWFGLEKYLKEHNCLVTNADWQDVTKMKYSVSYDITHRMYDTYNCTSHKDNKIYSTDWEVLEHYMNALSKENIKIMFDIDID